MTLLLRHYPALRISIGYQESGIVQRRPGYDGILLFQISPKDMMEG